VEKQGTASQLALPEGVLYIGVDESNHGRFPEIIVGAMSGLREKAIQGTYEKQRKINIIPPSWLNEIDYSFFVINKRDHKRTLKPNFIGLEISTLLQDLNNPHLKLLNISLDGIVLESKRHYVRDMVSEVCSFPKEAITFNFGAKFDEIYPLVNLADTIAYNLAFHSNPKSLENHPSRKYLIKG